MVHSVSMITSTLRWDASLEITICKSFLLRFQKRNDIMGPSLQEKVYVLRQKVSSEYFREYFREAALRDSIMSLGG